jgi:hypothetical protein
MQLSASGRWRRPSPSRARSGFFRDDGSVPCTLAVGATRTAIGSGTFVVGVAVSAAWQADTPSALRIHD